MAVMRAIASIGLRWICLIELLDNFAKRVIEFESPSGGEGGAVRFSADRRLSG